MEATQILPVLDIEALQKAANEFAMKGATETLKEFYSGYNSPYRKAINTALELKGIDSSLDLPDIIGILNDSFSKEIDIIANKAIAETYLPMVKNFLTRAPETINISEVLKQFISDTGYEYDNDKEIEHYEMNVEKEDDWFMCLNIGNNTQSYQLYLSRKSKKEDPKKLYDFYALPQNNNKKTPSYNQTMELSMEGGPTLKMPFTKNVLDDPFTSYIAKMVIAGTKVTLDVDDFEDDLFPERHCHC